MRVLRTVGMGLAAGALLLGLASTGPVRADDGPRIALSAGQVSAVTSARQAYLTAAWQAKTTYRGDVTTSRDAMDATLQAPRLAVLLAKDAAQVAVRYGGDVNGTRAALDRALAAYRTAYDAAFAAARAQADAARTVLRGALDRARTAYVAAITAAFPGTTPPAELLVPPGRGMGWFSEHDGWLGLNREFGMAQRFDTRMPMGMGWAWGRGNGGDDRRSD